MQTTPRRLMGMRLRARKVLGSTVINMAAVVPNKLLSRRIEKANELLERCGNLDKSIEGLAKLRRKILAELKFLKSVSAYHVRVSWYKGIKN